LAIAAHDTQISDTVTAAWSAPQKALEGRIGMAITIVLEEEPYRLITDGDEHYAVIEARNGLVYSLHSHDRHEAPDTEEGMIAVVGDGWREQGRAIERFQYMTRREARYSELIW
jgi:hypothetical protein